MTDDDKDSPGPRTPPRTQAADAAVQSQRDVSATVQTRTRTDKVEREEAADHKQNRDDDDIEVTLDATVGAGEAAPGLSRPEVKEGYDPGKYQDATRSYIAYWLLALLTVLVIGAFSLLFAVKDAATFANLKSILELIYGPIIALVSAATGFYFGAQQPGSNKK